MSAASSARPRSTAPTVAVVGATGIVGETVLRVLEERAFPVGQLRALSSAKSAASTMGIRVGERIVNHPSFSKVSVDLRCTRLGRASAGGGASPKSCDVASDESSSGQEGGIIPASGGGYPDEAARDRGD